MIDDASSILVDLQAELQTFGTDKYADRIEHHATMTDELVITPFASGPEISTLFQTNAFVVVAVVISQSGRLIKQCAGMLPSECYFLVADHIEREVVGSVIGGTYGNAHKGCVRVNRLNSIIKGCNGISIFAVQNIEVCVVRCLNGLMIYLDTIFKYIIGCGCNAFVGLLPCELHLGYALQRCSELNGARSG